MIRLTTTNMRVFDLEKGITKTGKAYCRFTLSTTRPGTNGLYVKYHMQAFDSIAERIETMKMGEGSIVDVISEPNPWLRDKKFEFSYNVKDIAFSELHSPNLVKKDNEKKKTEETIEKKEEENFMSLAHMLDSNPFS